MPRRRRPRCRKLTPGYWAACVALAVAGALIVWNFLTGLAYLWLTLASSSLTLLTTLWLFRMLWKQSDPLARRAQERNPGRFRIE